MTGKVTLMLFGALVASALGQTPSRGYAIPKDTLSPNRRYGVTVPLQGEYFVDGNTDEPKNSLVDTKNGRALAVICAKRTGWNAQNDVAMPARWSPDGSVLIWEVDGKWTRDALTVLKLDRGNVQWQIDVLQAVEQAIRARTRRVVPAKIASVKNRNARNGSATTEGFTVDARVKGSLSFPLRVEAWLTSNVKQATDVLELDAYLEGSVDAQGKFTVMAFRLDNDFSGHWDQALFGL